MRELDKITREIKELESVLGLLKHRQRQLRLEQYREFGDFWANVKATSDEVRDWPKWKREGIK